MNGEAVVNDLMISVFSEAGSCGSDLVCSVSGSANGVLTSTFTISGTESAFIAGYGDLTWSDFKSGYNGYYYQDTSVIDAEKCSAITQDNMMCWAGTAANMLYYTGWGLVGADTEDKVFSVFINNFLLGETYGGNAYHAIDWYFTGHYSPQTWSEWDIPLENSGGFYSETFKTEQLSSYLSSTTFTVSGLTTAKQKLEAGYGVGVTFGYYNSKGTRTGGHLITLWGMTCDSSYSVTDPRYYTGIIVTDSDDNKSVSDPLSAPDTLKIISITYDSSLGAYLIDPDYAGANSRLEHLTFLAPNTGHTPDEAGPVRIYSDGALVRAGESFSWVEIKGTENDTMHISSGGWVSGTFISSGGAVYVSGGGLTEDTEVYSGGKVMILGEEIPEEYWALHGSAKRLTVYAGGTAVVSGGEVSSFLVSSGGIASVAGLEDPSAVDVFASIHGAEIKSGGSLTIGNRAEFWGSTVFGGTVTVNGWANVYGELNFDLSERSAADTYIVDDITGLNLTEFSSYTISVSDNQANGTYKLAGNASSFSDTITIEGVSLTVNGTGVTIDGKQYTLAVTDSILTLTIGAAAPLGNVRIYSGENLVKQGDYFKGETIGYPGNDSMYVGNNGRVENTTFLNRAEAFIIQGGRADYSDVKGGYVNIESGGCAYNTKISGGYVGVRSNSFIGDTVMYGGYLYVGPHASASNTVLSGGSMNLWWASAYDTIVYEGYQSLMNGGVAIRTTLHSGTYLSGGWPGAVVSSATVSSGAYADVSKSTVVKDVLIRSGAYLQIDDSTLEGFVKLGGNMYVLNECSGNSAVVDFLVSERNTADTVMIDNIANLSDVSYTITVSADQTEGTYKLAGNAASFNETISISGETLAVGGTGVTVSGKQYTLAVTDSILTLTIGAAAPPVPVGDQVKVYSSGTLVKQGTVLTGETIVGGTNNSMFVYNGGTANSTTVNSSGWLNISSGGVANSTTVNTSGRMWVSSGGVANSTTVNTSGRMYISSGGVASSTTVNSSGGMWVYSDGVANSTTVNTSGWMWNNSGCTATNITALAGAYLVITVAPDTYIQGTYCGSSFEMKNAQIADFDLLTSGVRIHVSSGGVAKGTIASEGSWQYVYSGGVMSDTVINNSGAADVLSGGVASDTTVNSNGRLYVHSSGRAYNTIVNSGGYIFLVYTNTPAEGGGGTVYDTVVNAGALMKAGQGGVANNTIVCGSNISRGTGIFQISSGGTANSTTVNSSGWITISSGGVANDTVVNSAGSMYISNGGKHRLTLTMEGGAVVSAFEGGIVDFTVSEWNTTAGYLINDLSLIQGTPAYTITVNADQAAGTYKLAQGASNFTQTVAIGTETVNYGSITANGADFVYNGVTYSLDQVAGNLTLTIGAAAPPVPVGDQVKVYSSGTLVKQGKVLTGETIIGGANNSMFVRDGGTANSTTVNSGGSMYIYSGGVANSTTLGSGSVYVRGGVANSITANNGYVGVSSGGVAHSTTLNSKAWMYVTSDSVANDTIVNKTCFIGITSDGVVNGSVIDGTINVYAGGVANDTVMFNSGYMMVASVGVVNDTVLESEGEMRLYGGVANRTIVNSDGYIMVVSGGVANDTVVNSGGSASILSGGKHRVTLTMEAGAVVSAAEGGIIDFTVSERTTGDGYLINDLALIQGAPTYTITVNADQTEGTYKLAQGAGNFTHTVAIGTETVNYGSITANGADFVYNGVTYSLDQVAGNLTLTIGAAAPPVPAGDQVKVYSSGTLVKQGKVLTGETIISGANNSMFVYSGGTANSTFVNSSGLMNVSSGGLAYGTILSGASYFDIGGHAVSTSAPGEIKIHSGGIAENTRIYEGGIMYVFSGGTADETFVGSHGCLKVSSGGIANNVSMGKDWCWVGVSSGLINNVTNVGGSLGIFAGGTITNILLADNGERVYTGLCVYSGGTASNTIVNWQHVSVSSGGTVDTIEVKSGGAIYYSAGAILAGEHVYGGRVAIEGYVDAENADVTFDVSQRLTADSFIVSNLAYLNAGSFSITVAADQEKGTYMLAENADGFAGSLSVGTGTVNWGTVSVNGEQLTYNETVYKLVGESGNLHLVIEAADREAPELTITGNATEWTNRDVVLQVVCDDPEAVVSFRIDNGDWQVCTGTLTVRSNCSIEFRAVDRAGNTTTERVIVDKIDNVAPEAPKVTADITDFTNQSVTLTADYGDAVKKEFSYNNRTWYTYNGGVVLNSNSTVYFRGSDALGNVSGISSYKVDNIDKAAPGVPGEVTIAIDGNNAVADWNDVGDSGVSGVKGYFVRTGNSENMTGHGTFVEASRISLENLAEGVWYCQIASVDKAGNISEWSTVKSFVIGVPGPENLVSTPRGLSWDAVEGASGYVVEYSYDDFESAVAVETVTNALDSFALPGTTFKWRVRALESSVWSFGSEVTGNGSIDAEEIVSDNDGNTDLFFANANDLWGKGYAAENKFTGERIMLAGKNRLDEIFEGSSDANVLVLTDDLNGDALFVDDIYTALGDRARMEEIDEIRAGAGADVIDMTSLRYGYSGKEITIHGGDGDDVIWTGGTDSVLFGDAGDDRLAGSTCFDVFAGGSGNDTMCSGGGNDIFVFSGEFGNDTVEITDYSEVTLWFDAGSSENWDPVRRIYRSGSNSVTVTGSGAVDLKFGDEGGRYAEFAEAGLFDDVSSRKIFEEKDKGMLA